METDKPLKVAVLGCGSVGLAGGAPARRAGRRPRRPGSGRRSSWSASPYAASTRRARSTVPAGLLTTDADGLVARDDVDVVVEVIGGIEPARVADPGRARERRAGGHRQQGAARRGRPDALRGRREGRARPLLRGGRGRRDPDPAAAARVAGRRPGHPGARHRQRHHQLHPRQDGHLGAGFAEALEEAQELGYAEADPTADVEGFDAAAKAAILAEPGVPLPGHRRRRPPRGHLRGHRRRRRVRARDGQRGRSCSRSAELRTAPTAARSPSACTRR